MLANDTFNCIAAQPSSTVAYEQWLGIGSAAFLEGGGVSCAQVSAP